MNTLSFYKNTIQNRLIRSFYKRKNWHTNRKIVVIESDDWGSIRMPSKRAHSTLLKNGVDVNGAYNSYDSLASKDDLACLFEVLSCYKDINNSFAKITANTCVSNPDFLKIRDSDYSLYFNEPFTETIKKQPNCSFKLWEEGIQKKVFVPQLHGREHLNVEYWLDLLRSNNKNLRYAFDQGCWGVPLGFSHDKINHVLAEFMSYSDASIKSHKKSIEEAAFLFRKIFGYNSSSFIAPNYMWNSDLNLILKENGINFIQGACFQKITRKAKIVKYLPNYIGKHNNLEQFYLVRNCVFEPATTRTNSDTCLAQIKKCFQLKIPAIISSHRVNYIGALDVKNRDKTLFELNILLKLIIKKWPDVEFLSSDELGDIIKKDKVFND